jgi:thiol-disulfide isomerase/thioredoxin
MSINLLTDFIISLDKRSKVVKYITEVGARIKRCKTLNIIMKAIKLIIGIGLLISCSQKLPEHTGKEGKPLPSFTVLLPDSTVHSIKNEMIPGKRVLIFVFSPNCPYSRMQIRDILKNEIKFRNFQILAVTPYSFAEMKDFYLNFGLNDYSNIITGVDVYNFFCNYMNIHTVPYFAIYGKDKKLKKAFSGLTDVTHLIDTSD